jgi:hydroxypyruvate isomerase
MRATEFLGAMPRFSANLSFLYQELPFLDRLGAAAADGFRGVEYMSPYEFELAEIKRRLREHRLEQALFNLPVGDFAAGERGYASDPARVAEFRRGVESARVAARELGCTRLNCLVGKAIPGLEPATARATLLENLRYAAEALAREKVALVVEPLNRIETPGFLIGTSAEAFALIDETATPNLALQYDIYHAQRAEGNILATLRAQIGRIGHVQIADSPGRNEPGTGELAYERILPALDELGYAGWVGLEYKPLHATSDSFGWMQALKVSGGIA